MNLPRSFSAFLNVQHLVQHRHREPEAPVPGHRLGELLRQHRLPRGLTIAAPERAMRGIDGLKHRSEQLSQCHRLEVLCRLPRFSDGRVGEIPSNPGRPPLGWTCSSSHLQIGLQRARGLDGLQNADQIARPDAQRVQARHQIAQRRRRRQHAELACRSARST